MFMKKLIVAAVFIVLLISLSACAGLPTAGNGQMTDGSFAYTGAITKIEVSGVTATLNVMPEDSGAVTYTVDSNLKDLLKITYQDGVLGITTTNNKSITSKGIVFNIGAAALEAVTVDGAADVKGNGTFTANAFTLEINGAGSAELALGAQSVSVTLNGAGDITLSGTSDQLSINSSGAATVSARDLTAQDVKVVLDGAGTIQVTAEKTLDAKVSGVGSVTYWGDPTVTESTEGASSVVKGS
ncbi:MAG: DUF2807 domain-containing protein [Firmicutes bacterium]|nr:DUF2807 domain-containing protein [Bacillota bacterium]